MKKLLSLLLALSLLLPLVCLAEEEASEDPYGFYLYERRLVMAEDGVCMLHLRLMKAGGIQYCLDEVKVVLLDAEGNEIVPLTTEMIAPINPVPAGDQFFPVTMVYTLPEGAVAASYQILGIPGESFDEPAAEPMEIDAGYILMHAGGGPAATCWLEEPRTEMRHAGYMMVLHVYDVDDAYLGFESFSWEDADCEVPGSQAMAKLCELTGLTEDVIAYYGIEFNPRSNYYFFADRPLTGLLKDDIPASGAVATYRTKSPLVVLASTLEHLEPGVWRAYCLLQNGSCEPIDFNGHDVNIFDAAGEKGYYSSVAFDCALWELEAFGLTAMQYTFGGVPEDFVPETVTVSGKAIHEESPYSLVVLPQEHYAVRVEDGKVYLDVTIPEELCGETLNFLEAPVAGLLWYARNPEDMSMISCGTVSHKLAGPTVTGSWYVYRDVEINGIPEGVTPEILVYVIDTK
ncbi:MAG: hypothetical protein IJE07_05655 [Clostridia bacterium]|nr:hypothetical protein [Clostridia bacterium]